jgi:hypothetical protein
MDDIYATGPKIYLYVRCFQEEDRIRIGTRDAKARAAVIARSHVNPSWPYGTCEILSPRLLYLTTGIL